MKTSIATRQLPQADRVMSNTTVRATHQIEKAVLGHGDMTFEVTRETEFSSLSKPTLSQDDAKLLKADRPNAIAIASELIWMFGGIATVNGESQLVGSWDEIEELLEGNDLVFDSVRIEFQESRYEPILLLNTVVGSAIIPPLWEVHFRRLLPVDTGYLVTSIDCVVEIRTSQCVARLAPEYSKPFSFNELLVEG